ncbi:hypothetical protein B0T24DRAFT_693611, partial [Lasiosphaeria ovina]
NPSSRPALLARELVSRTPKCPSNHGGQLVSRAAPSSNGYSGPRVARCRSNAPRRVTRNRRKCEPLDIMSASVVEEPGEFGRELYVDMPPTLLGAASTNGADPVRFWPSERDQLSFSRLSPLACDLEDRHARPGLILSASFTVALSESSFDLLPNEAPPDSDPLVAAPRHSANHTPQQASTPAPDVAETMRQTGEMGELGGIPGVGL